MKRGTFFGVLHRIGKRYGGMRMKDIDRDLEQRVWRRVRGGQPVSDYGWQDLVRQELACAGELEWLAGKFLGRARGKLLKLAGRERYHGKMLARRLGMPLPRNKAPYRAAENTLERLEAVTGQLRDRAERYSDSAVRCPEDEMLRFLAWEERRGYELLTELMGQLRRGKNR